MTKKFDIKILFIYLYLIILIVSGNALTFNLFGRVSIKISEIISLILGMLFIRQFVKTRWNFSISIILFWALLSLVLIFINTLVYSFNINDVTTAFLYLFRFIYSILLSYIVFKYLKKKHKLLNVLKLINSLYIIVCIIGFFQVAFFPVAYDFYDIFWRIGVYFPNADYHINRLVSTYFDPNYLASCLILGFIINMFILNKSFSVGRFTIGKLKYYFYLLIYVVAIIFTKSRSGMLGLILVCIFSVLFQFNFKKIKIWHIVTAFCVLVLGVYLVGFSNIEVFVRMRNVFTDESAAARFISWRKGIDIIIDTNFLGLGYNLFGAYNKLKYGIEFESSGYGNDSSILLIFVTTGIIGFILFLVHYYHLFNKRSPASIKALGIVALIICNFNNLLFYSLWVFVFYFVVFSTTEIDNDFRGRLKRENFNC